MADNVDITPGTGKSIATDEVTTTLEHVQLFKLAYSADGSRTLVQVDADGVKVNDGATIADDAAFTAGTSKVLPVGYLADDASPDAADEGDAVAARTTLDRKQIVVFGESGANFVRGGGSKTDTTDQSLMAADANLYNYLCWVTVYNSSANQRFVNIKDGSTTVAVIPAPAYGGAIVNFSIPIRTSAVNTAINAAADTSTTTMYMYGGGYKGK